MTAEPCPGGQAPGLALGPGVEVPADAHLGAHVVLEQGVVLGAGCRLEHHSVVGKALSVGIRSRAQAPPPNTATVLEDGCVIGCGSVVVTGARIGAGAVIGDHALIRERVWLGAGVTVGHGSVVGSDTSIGSRTRLGACVLLPAATLIGEDCFIGSQTVFTDDNTIGRPAVDRTLRGPTLHRGCRIGVGAIVLSDVEIGEEAMVGAGSLVTASVPPRTLVVGSPARVIRELDPDSIPPLPPLHVQARVPPGTT